MSETDRALNMLERLNQEPVGFHRFILKYKKSKRAPYCLIEGEDSKYYRIRIKSICDGIEPIFIVCGGKRGVVDTHSLITKVKEYKQCKLLAFVDRDFDSPITAKDIYETPCYSIENFYTTLSTFKSILTDEFKLDEDIDKEDYLTCIDLFCNNQSTFHDASTELNAWIACQRDLSRSGHVSRLNLNSKENELMDRCFNFKLDQVVGLYSIEIVEEIFSQATKISSQSLYNKIFELNALNKQMHFRGKYELVFIKNFLKRLVNELNSRNSTYFKKKRKISFQISDSNILSQLSQYADTPNCLIDYVRSIWNNESVLVR